MRVLAGKIKSPDVLKINLSKFHIGLVVVVASLTIALTASTFTANSVENKTRKELAAKQRSNVALSLIQTDTRFFAFKIASWMVGATPREEVQSTQQALRDQVLRASAIGILASNQTKAEFVLSVQTIGLALADYPAGVLPADLRQAAVSKFVALMNRTLDVVQQAVAESQSSIEQTAQKVTEQQHERRLINLWLLIFLIGLASALQLWITQVVRRGYSRANKLIEAESRELAEVREELYRTVEELDSVREAEVNRYMAIEDLRNKARILSIALRDPENSKENANFFCEQVANIFSMDYAYLHVFADERLPEISALWFNSETGETSKPSPTSMQSLWKIVPTLWATSAVLVVDDSVNLSKEHLKLGQVVRRIGLAAQAADLKSFVILPLGEGAKAFGFLMLARHTTGLDWETINSDVLSYLGTHLGYSLIEEQLHSTQRVVEELNELHVAKDEFISTVNHELRTPLTSIIGYLDLIRASDGDSMSVEAAQSLDVIERNALTLRELVEDMLSIAHLDSGVSHNKNEEVDLLQCIEWSRFSLAPKAAELNISIVLIDTGSLTDSTHPEYLVNGNQGQLTQVCMNLLSNALKFSREDSTIIIRIGFTPRNDSSPGIRVEIEDTGIGISKDDLNQIFTRFFRGHNAVNFKVQGTGLGLSIVDTIVRMHDGTVDIQSELGVGTKVIVTLPVFSSGEFATEARDDEDIHSVEVETLVFSRREGVLSRAIETLAVSQIGQLQPLSHELAGALSLYTFAAEGALLKEFSRWLELSENADPTLIQNRLNEILSLLNERLKAIRSEETIT
ncbi:MAG TPA: HAMP domain-containing sensor histidine kinase [archaeon]|nr:HAMP domain-containing sensor histidine kinase [archaeon]